MGAHEDVKEGYGHKILNLCHTERRKSKYAAREKYLYCMLHSARQCGYRGTYARTDHLKNIPKKTVWKQLRMKRICFLLLKHI